MAKLLWDDVNLYVSLLLRQEHLRFNHATARTCIEGRLRGNLHQPKFGQSEELLHFRDQRDRNDAQPRPHGLVDRAANLGTGRGSVSGDMAGTMKERPVGG